MAAVPKCRLSSGYDIPMVGLGTWKSKGGQVKEAVKTAIAAGYRHIDSAFIYLNEAEVGEALKQTIAEGNVKRDELFITSKLWNTRHMPADVKPALKDSLQKLGLDYLDLYLIHWPQCYRPSDELFPTDADGVIDHIDIDPAVTWKAMEQCVDEGLVRSIGVSNFNSQQVDHVIENCRIKPVVNQVEIHPYFANDKLVQHCTQQGIAITAYSPLASADRPWASPDEPTLLEDPKLKELADKLKKSPAQVVLRWQLQRKIIIIPKSVTSSRIQENIDILDFELSDADMDVINSLNKNTRLLYPVVIIDGERVYRDRNAPNFPFNAEY